MTHQIDRRGFVKLASTGLLGSVAGSNGQAHAVPVGEPETKLKYIVGSCMYGYEPLEHILPQIERTAAAALDLWPKVHGNQREQLDEMGESRFAELLKQHSVVLGCITQYKLGPFGLKEEMQLANRLGCQLIVTGGVGPKGTSGQELKAAVGDFIEKMKPHLEIAAENDVTIAIENHGNNLFETADSLRYLAELRPNNRLGVALAPYHLPQDSEALAGLIRDLGTSLVMFYAWQHGMGCMQAQPREDELQQLPGRGSLDFCPLVRALRDIEYQGWTEIFMHPFPRGRAIADTCGEVTDEIVKSQVYLETCLE